MTRPALLDVNVLIALFDPDHVHHDAAHDWFADHRDDGWATCPLTELAFVRILSNAAYSPNPERPAQVLDRLRMFCDSAGHHFWADALSLRDAKVVKASLPAGHRQLTDIYLLALARRNKGRLATFDRSIPLAAVEGVTVQDLLIIEA